MKIVFLVKSWLLCKVLPTVQAVFSSNNIFKTICINRSCQGQNSTGVYQTSWAGICSISWGDINASIIPPAVCEANRPQNIHKIMVYLACQRGLLGSNKKIIFLPVLWWLSLGTHTSIAMLQ